MNIKNKTSYGRVPPTIHFSDSDVKRVEAIILSTYDFAGRIEDVLMLHGEFEYSFIKPPELSRQFCSTIPVRDMSERPMFRSFFRNVHDWPLIIVGDNYIHKANELLEEFADEDHKFVPITITDFIQLTKMKLL